MMPMCSERVRLWLPVFAAIVALTPIADVFAQQQQSRRPSASILIGGYKISLGMSIEQVNGSLGSVFTASMIDSKSWIYRQGDQSVAKVFLENGRVSQIVKFFGQGAGNSSYSDRAIKETKDAVEEFQNLSKGFSCYRLQGEDSPNGPGYQLNFRCGPYLFNLEFFKFGEADSYFSSSAVIYVTR